ncbi:WD repeat-containing protein 60 [Chytriomyces hyalinus]|nr:WD repeat-containing protein 60 [Chytriomyces hyalinus]
MNGFKKSPAEADAWLNAQFQKSAPNVAKDSKTVPLLQPNAARSLTPNKAVRIPTGQTNKMVPDAKETLTTRPDSPDAKSYGDDDFDAYDEDFDAFDDASVNEVQQALHEENERVSSKRSNTPEIPAAYEHTTNEPKPTATTPALPNHSYIHQKLMRRANDLKDMIDLDVAVFDIFEMQPLNEYEQYIRDFGSSNATQVSTQTNEDSSSLETQTDDWNVEDKWTQAPQEFLKDSDSGRPELPHLESERMAWDRQEKRAAAIQKRLNSSNLDSISLLRFVRSVGQIVDVLLEENTLGQAGYCETSESSNLRISHGMLRLGLHRVFGERIAVCAKYSETDYRSLIVSWSLPDKRQSRLDCKGLLAVYRVTDSKAPQQILLTDCEITSFTVPRQAPHFIIFGTEDGGIGIFDLREAKATGVYPELDVIHVPYKLPSYSIDGIYDIYQLNEAPVVGIFMVGEASETPTDALSDFKDQSVYQFYAIDEGGRVQAWTMIELSVVESQKHFESDFGLAIGGRVKLVRGSSFDLDPTIDEFQSMCITVAETIPTGSHDKFLVGTSMGEIICESRFRSAVFPRQYRTSHSTMQPLDKVTSLSFNPWHPQIFLSAFKSGQVALFAVGDDRPLITWKIQHAALQVLWSKHRPAVFFVLDAKSGLHIWDVLEQEVPPTYLIQLKEQSESNRRAVSISESPALSGPAIAANMSSSASLASSANRNASLAISYTDGDLDIHYLNEELVEQMVDESDQFLSWLSAHQR